MVVPMYHAEFIKRIEHKVTVAGTRSLVKSRDAEKIEGPVGLSRQLTGRRCDVDGSSGRVAVSR